MAILTITIAVLYSTQTKAKCLTHLLRWMCCLAANVDIWSTALIWLLIHNKNNSFAFSVSPSRSLPSNAHNSNVKRITWIFVKKNGKFTSEMKKMEPFTETDSAITDKFNEIIDSLQALPTDDEYNVTKTDIFFTFVSICGRFNSIVSTILLSISYYRNGKFDYCTWTLCCFLIPMAITTVLQLEMYVLAKRKFHYNFWSIYRHHFRVDIFRIVA